MDTRLVIRSVAARNVMIGAVVNSWNWNTPGAKSMGTRMNRTLLFAFSSCESYAEATNPNSLFAELFLK